MLEQIYTDPKSGTDFRVKYTKNPFGVVEYDDIRVVDGDYRSVGPNLVEFLMSRYDSLGTDDRGNISITPSLAIIAEELN
jgi:hypothetical protein